MVKIERLRFSYDREALFRDTDLVLTPGRIYGLLGLNGAGKSTLLRLMAGLLFPISGKMRVLAHEPARREPGFLSGLFVLGEEPHVPGVTAREYISVRAPFHPEFDHERMERYLGAFEIPGGRKLTQLSYGRKKKFLLSFGLACGAALLLLDEPTNGLDIPSKGLFRRLVAEALTDRQTFVISTHQVRDVESLIDLVVILHHGKVLLNHAVSDLSLDLRMLRSASRPDENADGLLYSEPTVGGFDTVWKDRNAGGGRLDLELLFKAFITRPETCSALFEVPK